MRRPPYLESVASTSGILTCAHYDESSYRRRPFKRVPGVNHVDIEGLSKAACINVLQIVKHGVVNLEREEREISEAAGAAAAAESGVGVVAEGGNAGARQHMTTSV